MAANVGGTGGEGPPFDAENSGGDSYGIGLWFADADGQTGKGRFEAAGGSGIGGASAWTELIDYYYTNTGLDSATRSVTFEADIRYYGAVSCFNPAGVGGNTASFSIGIEARIWDTEAQRWGSPYRQDVVSGSCTGNGGELYDSSGIAQLTLYLQPYQDVRVVVYGEGTGRSVSVGGYAAVGFSGSDGGIWANLKVTLFPPDVSIDGPSSVEWGETATFEGVACDFDGFIVETWFLEDGVKRSPEDDFGICETRSFSVSYSTGGTHTIGFCARDDDDLQNCAFTELEVNDDRPGDFQTTYLGPRPLAGEVDINSAWYFCPPNRGDGFSVDGVIRNSAARIPPSATVELPDGLSGLHIHVEDDLVPEPELVYSACPYDAAGEAVWRAAPITGPQYYWDTQIYGVSAIDFWVWDGTIGTISLSYEY